MLNAKSIRKVLCVILLATFALSLVATSPVLAYLYRATFTVSNNGSTDYAALPVSCSADVDWLIANGFITTSTALDTRVETLGGTEQIHMMAEDRIMAFCPTLDADSQLNWYLTTGNSALNNFPVIVGDEGNVTISDHADLELANNFSVEFEGWVDTSNAQDYPTVAGTNTSVESSTTTSHTVDLPAGIQSGDLLLAFFAGDYIGAGIITWPGDWTELFKKGTHTVGAIYKVATGGEGSSITVTTSLAVKSAHQTYRITEYTGAPEIANTSSVATSATPNPPSLTTSWGNSRVLWIAGFGGDDASSRTLSSYPTDYSDGQFTSTGGYTYVGSAVRELEAASEDPGVFTLSGSICWYAWTIGVRGDTNSLVSKAGAFDIYVPDTGELSAVILGASPLVITAAGISAEEYAVNVWADGTDYGIDIDGVTENSTALGGASVPSNANDYIISMPYFNCFNLTVNDDHRIRYEPDSLISGTTLLNEENPGTYDGAITWGSNPSGVSVTLGSLTAPESTVTTEEEAGGYQEAMHEVVVTDWFLEPDIGTKLAAHPLRPLVTIWSDNSTVTEVQAWRFLGLALLLLITVGAAVMVRGHLLIAGLACGGTIALLVQQTVWPGWTLVFIIPAIIAGVMAERTPSIG